MTQWPNTPTFACFWSTLEIRIVLTLSSGLKNQKNNILWHMKVLWNGEWSLNFLDICHTTYLLLLAAQLSCCSKHQRPPTTAFAGLWPCIRDSLPTPLSMHQAAIVPSSQRSSVLPSWTRLSCLGLDILALISHRTPWVLPSPQAPHTEPLPGAFFLKSTWETSGHFSRSNPSLNLRARRKG